MNGMCEPVLYGPTANPWDIERSRAALAVVPRPRPRLVLCRLLTPMMAAARYGCRQRGAGWSD